MRKVEVDLLVIGSGVAGAFAALTATTRGARVLLVTKGALRGGSTCWAQGGIAAPVNGQDDAVHAADTVRAGRGLCDKTTVNVFVREARELVDGLRKAGVPFGQDLTLEGGHSVPRIRHVGDATGWAISSALSTQLVKARAAGLHLLESTFVRNLRVRNGRVVGADLLTPTEPVMVRAGGVLLASGGYGGLFPVTTAPPEGTGDGLALAFRAGAVLRDLEFVQFHPTAVVTGNRARLVTEAARGEGAFLVNAMGERFMSRYDALLELAPRDVVARAIAAERERTGNVFLDLRHLGESFLARRFPTVTASLAELGLHLGRDPIPVEPAVHYTIGGVQTDLHGRTSLPGLYAAGEVASSGLHGANRLASNSLSEGLVFGKRAANAALDDPHPAPDWGEATSVGVADRQVVKAVRQIMGQAAGLIRGEALLRSGLSALDALPPPEVTAEPSIPNLEAGNLRELAPLLLRSALARQESRGGHARVDFPDGTAPMHTIIHRSGQETVLNSVPHTNSTAPPLKRNLC
ncbi:L-aspartate oxidase [Deinococcus fonticola]|uniref:L-aspartate oxidase n=1 Tax=Deinococcus fonticola TaxID=2528713 RepID=UPI0010753C32|nr:L-aspartate oxidase [Deinococcus fonticola]